MDQMSSTTSNIQLAENEKSKRKCKLSKTVMLLVIMCMTGSFFIVELVVGNITKSNALVADAFHMLSDLIALIIGLVAVRFSKKSSNKKNTFGWARAEILGALINTVFLLALCFTIYVEAINRFLEPEGLENIDLLLIVGGTGLAINIFSLILFWIQDKCSGRDKNDDDDDNGESCREDHQRNLRELDSNKKEENMNMRGVFLNALGDSLGSIAVIISGLIIKFVPNDIGFNNSNRTNQTTNELFRVQTQADEMAEWKKYIDPALSCIIATIIVFTVVPLFKKSSLIILQTVPNDYDINELKDKIKSIEGVVDVHHFHLWSLNPEKIIASAHVRVNSENDRFYDWSIVNSIKKVLHANNIHSTTIQLEHDCVSLDSCDVSSCPSNCKCCDEVPQVEIIRTRI